MFRILVADDDKNIRRLFRAILESAGYETVTAANGREALDIIDRTHIDLAVVDVMMPGLDGYELTRALRGGKNDVPILMVSAKELPDDKRRGFIAGADDYMTKPVDDVEFLLRIKALLRRAQIAYDRKIKIGDVTLDYDSMTVSRPGETVSLPQKEFLLLYKLMSSPSHIFTRIQLMDEIWGVESETGWETVTVHIARLRKRFEDWHEFEIESVRGLGYRGVRKR